MSTSCLTHHSLVEKLDRFRAQFIINGMHIGASEFIISLLNKMTFLQSSEKVFSEYSIKSGKYLELRKLSLDISKVPRAKELIHLMKYADGARNIQMSETYIGQIQYLTAKISELPKEDLNLLLRHVRNVTLLTGNVGLLQKIYDFNSKLLARFNFPETIKLNFPSHIASLIPEKRTPENIAYDKQNDRDYLFNIGEKDLSLLNDQQRLGLLVNKAQLENDDKTYLQAVNSLFSHYNLSSAIDVQLSAANVLSSLRFNLLDLNESNHGDFLTVIMSCYNSEDTVEYAVNSILKQSHRNFELLICDDNSSDGTLNILNNLAKKDSRIRVFKSKYNQGTYNIRNSLLELAKGEYITFQDSDDVAHPQRLAEQLEHIKSNNLLVSSCRWIRVAPEGNLVFFSDGLMLRFCVVSTMVHRTVFNFVPKFRSSLVAADTEFHENCLLLLGHGKVGVLDKPLILGLWGEGSLTKMENLNAEHNGFVAPRRRAYSEIAARQRVLGSKIVSDHEVNNVLRQQNIYREYAGVDLICGGSAL